MMNKLAVLFGLAVSTTCMVLPQPLPITYGLQYYDSPNYNFAYEVNDEKTGDIKSQHESRRGDAVLGQYTIVQPDGVKRTVDYRADDLEGFRATVNNEPRTEAPQPTTTAAPQEEKEEEEEKPNPPVNVAYIWPVQIPSVTPIPVAISRSSIVQTFSHGNHNPWL